MLFSFTVKNGERTFEDAGLLFFSTMKDGEYTMDVSKVSKRTKQQNRYYWLRNSVIATYTGYTKLEIHQALMERCGYFNQVNIGKIIAIVRLSSTELDKEQFGKLFDEQDEIVRDLSEDLERPIVLPRIEE